MKCKNYNEGAEKVRMKHGHWEAYYVCSRCGETVRIAMKECPFCHARMDGMDAVQAAKTR